MWQDLASEPTFEILSYAFSGSKLLIFRPHSFPWYLGQICRSWRAVFVSSPQFWRAFHIDFWNDMSLNPPMRLLHPNLPFAQHALAIVTLCIHRSKDHPLLFKYTTTTLDQDDSRPLLRFHRQILAALVAESARWQEADIVLQAEEFEVLLEVKTPFSLLRALQFSVIDHSDSHHAVYSVFANAPHLTHILWDFDPALKLSWTTLKAMEITIGTDLVPAFLDVLRGTECLEILILTCRPGRNPYFILGSLAPVTLPSLKILFVARAAYLIFFHCPILEQLWINNGSEIRVSIADESRFRDNIPTFFSSIRHLKSFVYSPENASQAGIILQHLPRTNYLYLSAWDPDILESLISSCPNTLYLQSLTLGMADSLRSHALLAAFADVLERSRKGEESERRFGNIEEIELRFHCLSQTAFTELEKECSARGIQLVIRELHTPSMRSELDVKIFNI